MARVAEFERYFIKEREDKKGTAYKSKNKKHS
ncbi:hypothetical protein ES708_29614 [subsurface metagenome]